MGTEWTKASFQTSFFLVNNKIGSTSDLWFLWFLFELYLSTMNIIKTFYIDCFYCYNHPLHLVWLDILGIQWTSAKLCADNLHWSIHAEFSYK